MTIKKLIIVNVLFLGTGLMSLYAALNPDTVLQQVVAEIFSPIYQLVAAGAVVYFLYGAAKFVHDMNHPEEKNTGKQHLFWGMIGLLIIFSVGGILSLFGNLFGPLGFK